MKHLNLLLSLINFSIYITLNVFLFRSSSIVLLFIFSPIYIYLLHNIMNFVHQASHNYLAKNKLINNVFGYIYAIFSFLSFSEFKKTHILHHAHTLNPEKDPDWDITNNVNLLILPFYIWKKDVYFLKHRLWKKKISILYLYLSERFIQLMFVFTLLYTSSYRYLIFFITSLLIVGYLNALFLFYLPHYQLKMERQINTLKNNTVKMLFFWPIKLCRKYHSDHHKRVKSFKPYFPVEDYLLKKIIK